MRVANLQWADFVVWSPVDLFFQRIKHDSTFMNDNLLKAHTDSCTLPDSITVAWS